MNEILLADGSILLNPCDVTKNEVEKVISLFHQALGRIPLDCRKVITDYWRSRSAPKECSQKSQSPTPYKTSVVLTNNEVLPRVWYEGHRVNLSSIVLGEMGNEFAVQAILHELTHVYFYAKCEPNHWVDINADQESKKSAERSREQLVTDQMRVWGIDQTNLLKWRDDWEAKHPQE